MKDWKKELRKKREGFVYSDDIKKTREDNGIATYKEDMTKQLRHKEVYDADYVEEFIEDLIEELCQKK